MPSEYHLAVRSIVNAEDPVGLIAMDCPDDEYDSEVEDLIKWRDEVTPERVIDTFVRWFGEDGRVPRDVAVRIAVAIESVRPGSSGRAGRGRSRPLTGLRTDPLQRLLEAEAVSPPTP